ncbi:hypothetical protein AAHA92_20064 [Salvia divinorum]|uniref:RING-CH-type domain-containing protein n=1 Tax=Salvia divinorum TaxID=28513 RepID=A0ABD1GFZ3_SALDI
MPTLSSVPDLIIPTTLLQGSIYNVVQIDGVAVPTQNPIASSSTVALTTIHRQRAVCRQCSKLVTDADSDHVSIIKCNCSGTSDLVHDGCKDEWSRFIRGTCSVCHQQIMFERVKLSTHPPQAIGDNSQSPQVSKWKRFWCC